MLLLSVVPAFTEATTIALVGMGVFNMPIEVSYAMGFAAGSVATVIVAEANMRLSEQGYGKEKGIGGTLIAASTFDNITNLVCFGICRTIAFQIAGKNKALEGNNDASLSIGFLFVQVICGVLGGFLMGLIGWVFKLFERFSICIYLKCAYCIMIGVGFIIAGE